MGALRAEEPRPTFASWIQSILLAEGIKPSRVHREYIRQNGNRAAKTFYNWCDGTSSPDVENAARVVRALETLLPEEDIRESFEAVFYRFERAPSRGRGSQSRPRQAPLMVAVR